MTREDGKHVAMIPVYLVMLLGYWLWDRSKWVLEPTTSIEDSFHNVRRADGSVNWKWIFVSVVQNAVKTGLFIVWPVLVLLWILGVWP